MSNNGVEIVPDVALFFATNIQRHSPVPIKGLIK